MVNSSCSVIVGTPAVTSRGYGEADMKVVSDYLNEAVDIALSVKKQTS